MAQLEQQPLIDAMERLTSQFNAVVAGMAELKKELIKSGLAVDDTIPVNDIRPDTEQATSDFISSDDKRLVHATIAKIAQLKKYNSELNEILKLHQFKTQQGDTPEKIKNRIDLCQDWQSIRALLNDLLALLPKK